MRYLLLAAIVCNLSLKAEDIRPRPTTWAQPLLGAKIKNIYKLNDDIYRSAQPDEEDVVALKEIGIKSILSLRNYHSDKGEIEDESIKLYRIPMNAGNVDKKEILSALKIIEEAPKPILIHCWHGSDRTGLMAALYRIVFEDWRNDEAIDEFRNGGFGYHEFWYKNIEVFLRDVNGKALKLDLTSH